VRIKIHRENMKIPLRVLVTVASINAIFTPNVQADDRTWAKGWDHGLNIRRAIDPGKDNTFYLDHHMPNGAQYSGTQGYELVYVAEQGGDQNNRRHTARPEGSPYEYDYHNGVNPFYFSWAGSANDPIANLLTNSGLQANSHRYYTNSEGQRKNSQDDSMFSGFYEQDNFNGPAHMPRLDQLVYHARIYNYGPYYNPRPHSLDKDGGRILFGLGWKSQGRQYLVEINVGGSSNNPSWGSDDACVHDNGGHGNLDVARYMILGAEGLSGISRLQSNQWTFYKVRWGEILRSLKERPAMLKSNGDTWTNCKLDVDLLQTDNNTIGVGAATEVHGAVSNRLLVKDTRVYWQNRQNWISLGGTGFYRYGGSSFYVNKNGNSYSHCLITRTDNNHTYTELPKSPTSYNSRDDGICAGQPSIYPTRMDG